MIYGSSPAAIFLQNFHGATLTATSRPHSHLSVAALQGAHGGAFAGQRNHHRFLHQWVDNNPARIGGCCALQVRSTQPSGMAAAAKPSEQPRTESCVTTGDGRCEA
jgi:hypothetical protein